MPETENTIEVELVDEVEVPSASEASISFEQSIQSQAQALIDRKDSREDVEKFEAVFNSIEEVVANEKLDLEQWQQIYTSAGSPEDSRLSRSQDQPEWKYTDAAGNETSLTQSVGEQADAEILARHEQILDGLYTQGFAVAEYYDEITQSTVKEIYFADEKDHINYTVFASSENTPLLEVRDDITIDNFDVTDEFDGNTIFLESAENIVQPLQIDLTEFFETQAETGNLDIVPETISYQQPESTFSTIVTKEHIPTRVENQREPIVLAFVSPPEIKIKETISSEQQISHPTIKNQQTEINTANENINEPQLATNQLEQKSISARDYDVMIIKAEEASPFINITAREEKVISLEQIEQAHKIQSYKEEADPTPRYQEAVNNQEHIAMASNSVETDEIIIEPDARDIQQKSVNIGTPEQAISIDRREAILVVKIKEQRIEEFDDISVFAETIVPEAITLLPEQKTFDVDQTLKTEVPVSIERVTSIITLGAESKERVVLFNGEGEISVPDRSEKNQQKTAEQKELAKVLPFVGRDEAKNGITLGQLNNRARRIRSEQKEGKDKLEDKESLSVVRNDNAADSRRNDAAPLYNNQGNRVSRLADVRQPNTLPLYNNSREILAGRTQPGYFNNLAAQTETSEVTARNDSGISIVPIKTAQLELAA